MSVVTSLGFSITSRWDGDGARRARRDLNRLTSDMDKNNTKIGETAAGIFNLSTAIVSLAPGLMPIITVAAGVTAATASMGVAAGSAFGIWGLALNGAITRIGALQKAHEGLNPVQKTFIASTDRMSAAWNKFLDKTESTTLGTASIAVDGVTGAIGKLAPVVTAVDPIVRRVAESFKRWATGSGMDRFVALLIQQGVPALNSLVNAGRSVVTVLGIGFRTFLPMGVQIAGVLERGAAALARWAGGGGFSRFLATVQANGPQVKQFFVALGGALKTITAAMVSLGPFSLSLSINLLRIVAALPPSWIRAIVLGFVAWKTAMAGLLIIRVIISLIQAFRIAWFLLNLAFMGTPLGWIILGIGLLIAAIILIATKTRWFQQAWTAVWNACRTAAIAVWHALVAAFHATLNALKAAWSATGNAIKSAWRATWNAIRSAGQAVWNAIKSGVSAVMNFLRSRVSSGMSAVRGVFTSAWNAVRGIITRAWSAIRSAVSRGISTVLGLIRRLPGQIRGALGNLGGLLVSAGRAIISGLIRGIKSMAGAVKSAVGSVLKAARNLLPFSPAKEGPFSGKGWTLYSGQALMMGFAKGVDRGAPQAIKATQGAMGRIAAPTQMVGSVAGVRSVGGHSHDGGGGVEVVFQNCTFSGGQGDFENMVVKAVSEAKRKKRL